MTRRFHYFLLPWDPCSLWCSQPSLPHTLRPPRCSAVGTRTTVYSPGWRAENVPAKLWVISIVNAQLCTITAVSLIKVFSRGRQARFRCQLRSSPAPTCHRQASVPRSLAHFHPSSRSHSLSVGIWAGTCLSQLGLTPSCPLSSPAQKELGRLGGCSLSLPLRETCLQEGGEWLPDRRPNSSLKERVLTWVGDPSVSSEYWAFCPGLFLPLLPTPEEKSQVLVPSPTPPTSWLDFPGSTGICCLGPSSERNLSPSGFNFWDS